MLNYKIKIIDNFLSDQDFLELTKIAKNLNINQKFNVYHNEIDQNNKIIKSTIDKDLLIKINNNYFSKSINILKELNPDKAKLFSYSDFTIIKTKKDSKFPIHDDTPNKLLSGVIYLYPENNKGTVFYNNKMGSDKTEIEWKLNRAVFFSRKERETWHSYKGDGINDRIALVYNLMTDENNIKKICKIEKKNYIYSNLRFKLNPYLFRYFNKTI
tara:strand:- start:485 stop:1126 length:642 start_codon:yes stop_codon:yes gene_type:complete